MKLSKNKKIAIIVLLVLIILSLLTVSLLEITVPHYREKKVVVYKFNSQGSIDYKVYLKPGIMFDEEYLGEDRYYVLKYIDYIEMNFEYEFSGSSAVEIKTEYSITAYLQGLHGPNSEVLWSKEFPLVPLKTQQGKYEDVKITEHVSIDPVDYYALKEYIYMESEVNAPVVLNIAFKVSSSARTENGVMEDSLSPGLLIPIGENVFKISGNPTLTGGNKIEETVKESIPVNKRKVIFLSAFSLIFAALLIITAKVEETEQQDPYEKTITRIFKEYGERMAGMEHAVTYLLNEVIYVNSIEDMVKIADEVGQPVFYYRADKRNERKIEFYVFDNNKIYYKVMFGEVKQDDKEQSNADKDTSIA